MFQQFVPLNNSTIFHTKGMLNPTEHKIDEYDNCYVSKFIPIKLNDIIRFNYALDSQDEHTIMSISRHIINVGIALYDKDYNFIKMFDKGHYAPTFVKRHYLNSDVTTLCVRGNINVEDINEEINNGARYIKLTGVANYDVIDNDGSVLLNSLLNNGVSIIREYDNDLEYESDYYISNIVDTAEIEWQNKLAFTTIIRNAIQKGRKNNV